MVSVSMLHEKGLFCSDRKTLEKAPEAFCCGWNLTAQVPISVSREQLSPNATVWYGLVLVCGNVCFRLWSFEDRAHCYCLSLDTLVPVCVYKIVYGCDHHVTTGMPALQQVPCITHYSKTRLYRTWVYQIMFYIELFEYPLKAPCILHLIRQTATSISWGTISNFPAPGDPDFTPSTKQFCSNWVQAG